MACPHVIAFGSRQKGALRARVPKVKGEVAVTAESLWQGQLLGGFRITESTQQAKGFGRQAVCRGGCSQRAPLSARSFQNYHDA